LAIAGTKLNLNYARDHSVEDGLNYVAAWNMSMLQTLDLKEVFKAKEERRDLHSLFSPMFALFMGSARSLYQHEGLPKVKSEDIEDIEDSQEVTLNKKRSYFG